MNSTHTDMDPEKDSFIYRLRHSLAHILAQAVLEIRPDAKLAFGPPVEFGFYYDFDFGDRPIGEAELEDLENRMRKIVKAKQPFERSHRSLEESIESTTMIEAVLKEFPEVKTVVSRTGRAEIATDPMGVETSDIYVILEPPEQWKSARTKEELIAKMDAALKESIPGNIFSYSQPIELRVQELLV